MFKNVASQKIALLALDETGAPKTGDAANITAFVNKDWAGKAALADTSATEIDATDAKGWYLFDVSQAETNADVLHFTGKSSTSGVTIVGQIVFTRPQNFPALAIDSNGRVKIQFAFNKGVAAPVVPFFMTTTDAEGVSSPATGKTVSCFVSKDGGAFTATATATATEIGDGWYYVPLTGTEMNANQIELRCTATGTDDGGLMIHTFA